MPEGLDWNIWQGPAPERPYNPNRYTYGWRWLWDYGTGDMGNDGVHDLDIARWGLAVDYPTQVQCTADKLEFVGDIQETPDSQVVAFTFPEKQAMLVYEQRLWSPYFQEGYENGVAFYGTEGYIVAGRQAGSWWRNVITWPARTRRPFPTYHISRTSSAASNRAAHLTATSKRVYKSTLLAHLGKPGLSRRSSAKV